MLSNKLKRVLCAFLSLTFIVCVAFGDCATAFADSKTDALNSQKDKLEEKIENAEKELDKLASEKKKTKEYLTALDKQVQLIQDKIDVLNKNAKELKSQIASVESKIKATEQEINSIQKEIDKKQALFDQTFDDYCQRLRAMYVSGSVSNLEVLLSSTDMSSILVRTQMISSVSQQDSKTLDTLLTQMEQIEKDKAALEQKRNDLKEDKAKLESDKAELDASLKEQNASKAELDKKVNEANALMRTLSSQESEYNEAIENSEEEIERINAEIRAAYADQNATSGSGSVSGGGRLSYPTTYRAISAGYPNYSSGRYHGGVDWPCPTGTPVRAAASGTVIRVQALYYSYGHYIIIDHGDGLSTLYAHNSQLLVSYGQKVTKGQLIAKSGSTGNSTGPHVHFEVRVNGTRVNPLNYL